MLHGKAMSYNNPYVDADSARWAAFDFAEPCVASHRKHSNPCGIAVGNQHRRRVREGTLECDPLFRLRRRDRDQQRES